MQDQTNSPGFNHGVTALAIFASICCTPVLACIGYCCIDESNFIIRTSYTRGIGFGYIIWGTGLLAFLVILYVRLDILPDFGLECWFLAPLGIICLFIGWSQLRNSRRDLEERVHPTAIVFPVYQPGPGYGPETAMQYNPPQYPVYSTTAQYGQPQYQPYRAPSPVYIQQDSGAAPYYSQPQAAAYTAYPTYGAQPQYPTPLPPPSPVHYSPSPVRYSTSSPTNP
ncbi:hypothetical protein BCR33DRAFT_423616 [Rhizoclosmatium globosum]|uniref:Uncharacterized protein n=1 Tax=Rhizoclosmatium globosum TaxID=329046 RepID=A0A1Y2BVY3_9FUNG|nr:hypothetical protein BCR33DRAFT_423616 [Rhizoclosmatium globosum]|eukprot:ORY38893.1 hypothetical protein BCR33DRAFT_423616 [Rhizoclosmatium globosum]